MVWNVGIDTGNSKRNRVYLRYLTGNETHDAKSEIYTGNFNMCCLRDAWCVTGDRSTCLVTYDIRLQEIACVGRDACLRCRIPESGECFLSRVSITSLCTQLSRGGGKSEALHKEGNIHKTATCPCWDPCFPIQLYCKCKHRDWTEKQHKLTRISGGKLSKCASLNSSHI